MLVPSEKVPYLGNITTSKLERGTIPFFLPALAKGDLREYSCRHLFIP